MNSDSDLGLGLIADADKSAKSRYPILIYDPQTTLLLHTGLGTWKKKKREKVFALLISPMIHLV